MARRPKTHCSAVTNRTVVCRATDGRSHRSRRFKDILFALSEPLGGYAALPEDALSLVRMAAAISIQCEDLQSATVAGEDVDPDTYVRLANSLTRILSALKDFRKPKDGEPTLDEIIAQCNAEAPQ